MTLFQPSSSRRTRTRPAARKLAANHLTPPESCPIGPDVDQVVEASGTLGRSLRRLRRDLEGCKTCAAGADCARWADFQATVTQALNDVSQEWQPQ